jgi:hypothetical protein
MGILIIITINIRNKKKNICIYMLDYDRLEIKLKILNVNQNYVLFILLHRNKISIIYFCFDCVIVFNII